MLASSSTTRTRGRAVPVAGAGARGAAARRPAREPPRGPLAVEPGVDVALAEPPLAADAHRGNLPGLDQPVDRPQVDLEVLEDFFGRQKRFVNHAFSVLGAGVEPAARR